jgi:hypothetical protein
MLARIPFGLRISLKTKPLALDSLFKFKRQSSKVVQDEEPFFSITCSIRFPPKAQFPYHSAGSTATAQLPCRARKVRNVSMVARQKFLGSTLGAAPKTGA